MSALAVTPRDRRTWLLAGALALAAHALAAAALLDWSRPVEPPVPEPVVLVELPEMAAAPAPNAAPAEPRQPMPEQPDQPQAPAPPLAVPQARAPLPADPVTLPPPATVRAAPAPAPAQAVPVAPPAAIAPAGTGRGASPLPGADPRAKQAEVDYRAIVNAYLARRKSYPAEAKKAHQEGTVAIRFTVDRNGGVSDVRLIRGSGHDVLDAATLALLQRVAPLPRMPASVPRDSMPMAVAIEYSLKTS
jgi:protein TonB